MHPTILEYGISMLAGRDSQHLLWLIAEFVSCPSCGRTLFDLQEVTESIRTRTGHLPGLFTHAQYLLLALLLCCVMELHVQLQHHKQRWDAFTAALYHCCLGLHCPRCCAPCIHVSSLAVLSSLLPPSCHLSSLHKQLTQVLITLHSMHKAPPTCWLQQPLQQCLVQLA